MFPLSQFGDTAGKGTHLDGELGEGEPRSSKVENGESSLSSSHTPEGRQENNSIAKLKRQKSYLVTR